MKTYIAQIDGFTMEGSVNDIQTQWDSLKTPHSFKAGTKMKFYAVKHVGSATVTSMKAVKVLTV